MAYERIVINVITGEKTVVAMTADEVAAAQARAAAEEAAKNTPQAAVTAIQKYLDAEAQKIDPETLIYFDSIHTAGIWVNSANPARAARAKALIAWADAVWDFATAEQIKQMAGNPTYSTVAELIEALPKI